MLICLKKNKNNEEKIKLFLQKLKFKKVPERESGPDGGFKMAAA